MELNVLGRFRDGATVSIHGLLPNLDDLRIFRIVVGGHWTNLLSHSSPHLGVFSIVTENIGEHPLCLEGVWKVHDDPRPLFGHALIFIMDVAPLALGFLCKVVEGLADSRLVATVGELAVENGFIPMDTNTGFSVRENS